MEMVNLIVKLFQPGYQYHSLNAYRSAMSSIYEKVDGYEGQHPLVTRLIKGAFHEQPTQPRYTWTWDVAPVTTFLEIIRLNLEIGDLAMNTALTDETMSCGRPIWYS